MPLCFRRVSRHGILLNTLFMDHTQLRRKWNGLVKSDEVGGFQLSWHCSCWKRCGASFPIPFQPLQPATPEFELVGVIAHGSDYPFLLETIARTQNKAEANLRSSSCLVVAFEHGNVWGSWQKDVVACWQDESKAVMRQKRRKPVALLGPPKEPACTGNPGKLYQPLTALPSGQLIEPENA